MITLSSRLGSIRAHMDKESWGLGGTSEAIIILDLLPPLVPQVMDIQFFHVFMSLVEDLATEAQIIGENELGEEGDKKT